MQQSAAVCPTENLQSTTREGDCRHGSSRFINSNDGNGRISTTKSCRAFLSFSFLLLGFLWPISAPLRLVLISRFDYINQETTSVSAYWIDRDRLIDSFTAVNTTVLSPEEKSCRFKSRKKYFKIKVEPWEDEIFSPAATTSANGEYAQKAWRNSLVDLGSSSGDRSLCSEGVTDPILIGGFVWPSAELKGSGLDQLCERVYLCVDDDLLLDFMWKVLLADIEAMGGIKRDGTMSPTTLNANFRRLTLSNDRELYLLQSTEYRQKRRNYIMSLGNFSRSMQSYSSPSPQYRLGGNWVVDNKTLRQITNEESCLADKPNHATGTSRSYMESLIAHLLPLDLLTFRSSMNVGTLRPYILPDENNCSVSGKNTITGRLCFHQELLPVLENIVDDGLKVLGCKSEILSPLEFRNLALSSANALDVSVLSLYLERLLDRCAGVREAVVQDMTNSKTLAWYVSQMDNKLPFQVMSSSRMGKLFDGELRMELTAAVGPDITLGDSSATIWTAAVEGYYTQQQWCADPALSDLVKRRTKNQYFSLASFIEERNPYMPSMTMMDCLSARYTMMPLMHTWVTRPFGGLLSTTPATSYAAEEGNITNTLENEIVFEMEQRYRKEQNDNGGGRLNLMPALKEIMKSRPMENDTLFNRSRMIQFMDTHEKVSLQRETYLTTMLLAQCGSSGGCTQIGGRATSNNNSIPYIQGSRMGILRVPRSRFSLEDQRSHTNFDDSMKTRGLPLPYTCIPVPACTAFYFLLIRSSDQSRQWFSIGSGTDPCNIWREMSPRWGVNGMGSGLDYFTMFTYPTNVQVSGLGDWSSQSATMSLLGFNTTELRLENTIDIVSPFGLFSTSVVFRLLGISEGKRSGMGRANLKEIWESDYGIKGSIVSSYGRLDSLSNFAGMISTLLIVIDTIAILRLLRSAMWFSQCLQLASGSEGLWKWLFLDPVMFCDAASSFLTMPRQYFCSKGFSHTFFSNLSSIMIIANVIRPRVLRTLTENISSSFLDIDHILPRIISFTFIASCLQVLGTVWALVGQQQSTRSTLHSMYSRHRSQRYQEFALTLKVATSLLLRFLMHLAFAFPSVIILQGGFAEDYVDNASLVAIISFGFYAMVCVHWDAEGATQLHCPNHCPPYESPACLLSAVKEVAGDGMPTEWCCPMRTATWVESNFLALRWDEASVLLAVAEFRGRRHAKTATHLRDPQRNAIRRLLIQRQRVSLMTQQQWSILTSSTDECSYTLYTVTSCLHVIVILPSLEEDRRLSGAKDHCCAGRQGSGNIHIVPVGGRRGHVAEKDEGQAVAASSSSVLNHRQNPHPAPDNPTNNRELLDAVLGTDAPWCCQ